MPGMMYHCSSRIFSSLLWTVLLFLLSACSDHYGSIGPPTLSREESAGGEMTLHAGIPGGSGTADGTGANARFNRPFGVVAFGGFLYVADRSNHVIRSVDLGSRKVDTVAGSPGRSGTSNGRGKDARFNSPEGITISTDGKILYVADTGNHAIRKITLDSGEVVTLAGRRGTAGSADSTNHRGDTATFRFPGALTVLGGYLYVADSDNHRIRGVDTATG
ncbi:MAG: hypothetical protein HY760_05640, partial [Nitrospirae bacterium]|nr:hypothetical protein [Nitrospirota bacterium]